MDVKKQTAVEWLFAHLLPFLEFSDPKEREHFRKCLAEAKAMEKEQHQKFNKFLNVEKELGIADLKTIERIQWYYNTYFNETHG